MGSSPSIHDVNAESAEHIAVVIQISILSNQSLFVVNLEDVLRTHFARHGAQVYQLTVATDDARLHSHCEKQGAPNHIRPEACERHARETVTQVDGQ